MLKLSLKMTLRDWRAGELRFLLAALTLAVASLSAVHFFADRMGAALQRDAHQLLGADLLVTAEPGIDPVWRDQARRLGLRSADTVELESMAVAGQGETARSRLVSLKAVTSGYPLRGALTLREPGGAAVPARATPAAGTAWVDPALLASLNIELGATIGLGELQLTVTRAIAAEPDRGLLALAVSPRVMIAAADLAASQLVQGGSLASHHLLLAGDGPALAAFEQWLKAGLLKTGRKGVVIDTLASSQASTSEALAKAQRFLSLIGLLSAMLASVAVAMAARRFMHRHADACAMLRCLGMPHARVVGVFMIEFLMVGLGASAAGVLLGFAGHFVLLEWLGTLVTHDMAPPGWLPALRGMAVGVLLLIGFGLPPLLALRTLSHNRLMRQDGGAPQASALATYGLGSAMFGALLVWQAGDLSVGLISAAAFLAALALFIGVAWLALASLRYAPAAFERGIWRLALGGLRHRPGAAVTQVVALALGLMALLLMTVVRGDLFEAWKNAGPADAPNHMVLNILPEQRAAVALRLQPYGRPSLYPQIPGHLLSVNGKPLDALDFKDERAKRMIEQTIDLSSAATLPASNTLVAGRWFGAGTGPELSVSELSAKALNLKLGDRLVLDIAGQNLAASVTSLRKIDWRSRQANFAFLLNPAAARDLPATFVGALYLPASDAHPLERLVQDYPNLTMLDAGAMIAQFQRVLDQIAVAVEFLFLYTLASGVLVLYITLAASQVERSRQSAVLRALGASRAQLARAQWIEFSLTGALAGLLAAAGASAGEWALARFAFQLEWHFSPALWLAGLLAGAACALLGGWAALRAVLNRAPMHSLRAI